MYVIPQSGRVANSLLRNGLSKEEYYEAASTPGPWKDIWQPIQAMIIVDGFGIEYVGKQHIDHLAKLLKHYDEIWEEWK